MRTYCHSSLAVSAYALIGNDIISRKYMNGIFEKADLLTDSPLLILTPIKKKNSSNFVPLFSATKEKVNQSLKLKTAQL